MAVDLPQIHEQVTTFAVNVIILCKRCGIMVEGKLWSCPVKGYEVLSHKLRIPSLNTLSSIFASVTSVHGVIG